MKKLSKIWNIIFAVFFIVVLLRMFGVSVSSESDRWILSYFEYLSKTTEWLVGSGLFPIFFLIMWLFISYLLSKRSGWSRLNERFALSNSENFAGNVKMKMGSANINGISFNNCLRVGANENGILLKMVFLFRFGFPPLFIPWWAIENISSDDTQNSAGFFGSIRNAMQGKYYFIRLREFPDFRLKIMKSTYEISTIPKFYGGQVK